MTLFRYIYCGGRRGKIIYQGGGAQFAGSLMYLQSEEIWTFNYVAIVRCDGIFLTRQWLQKNGGTILYFSKIGSYVE